MSGDVISTLIGAAGEREPIAELHRLSDVRARARPRRGGPGAPGPQPGLLVAGDRRRPRCDQTGRPQEVRSKVSPHMHERGTPMPSADIDEAPIEADADAPVARGRGGRSRRGKTAEGPRASFAQLLPYLFEHKRTLVVVVVLSILGAVAIARPAAAGRCGHRAGAEGNRPRGAPVGARRVRRDLRRSSRAGSTICCSAPARPSCTRAAAGSSPASSTCRSASSTRAAPATSSRGSAATRPCSTRC